jgi:hypothetical protein
VSRERSSSVLVQDLIPLGLWQPDLPLDELDSLVADNAGYGHARLKESLDPGPDRLGSSFCQLGRASTIACGGVTRVPGKAY